MYKMESVTIQERCIGLDPLSRSTMKLFVRDVLCLQPANCPSLKRPGTGLLSYKGHVVNRVEIMGIVVRVDKREKRHSYAVDDGTGVIQCTFWKNLRNDSLKDIQHSELPFSLQGKLEELKAASVVKNEEGFEIGDLLLVRGSVKLYMEQLEIDVLDHRKIENVCLEYQRVVELASLYKLYSQPVRLPLAIERFVNNTDQNAFSKEAVESAIAREIQARFSSPTTDPIFTPENILSWPAVKDSLQQEEAAVDLTVHATPEQIIMVKSALLSLEETRGWVLQQKESEKGMAPGIDRFEMVTSNSPLSRQVLSVLCEACLKSDHYSEQGCHIMFLLDRINESRKQGRRNKSYRPVTKPALCRALESLVISSDVIEVSNQRYIPLA